MSSQFEPTEIKENKDVNEGLPLVPEENEEKKEPIRAKDKQKINCTICCGKVTEIITCCYCNNNACMKCQKTYILDNNSPHCMYCKKEWSNEFVMTKFPKAFVLGKFKLHREKILFDLEKALLPETQRKFELQRRASEEITKLKEMIREYEKKYINPIKEKIVNLHNDYRMIEVYEDDGKVLTAEQKEEKEEHKSVFNKPCPKAGCRGFLTTRYRCGTCDTKVCNRCHEIKLDPGSSKLEPGSNKEVSGTSKLEPGSNKQEIKEHVCNEDTVKTIELMKKECKNCPKCRTLISKISGCDMMWCTQCKTAFSWKTGQIETGHIHNPHYWEYLRNNNRDTEMVNNIYGNGNQMCGVDWNNLYFTYRQHYLSFLIREINHIQYVELGNYRVEEDLAARNEELRERYLLKSISEEKFKSEIQKRHKKNNFNMEMRQILEMFINVVKDTVIRKESENIETRRDVLKSIQLNTEIFTELKNILKYVRDNISKICYRYGYSVPKNSYIYHPDCFNYLH